MPDNVRHLADFRAARPAQPKRTILPPADPRTFVGPGYRFDAGPGFIDVTLEGRTKRFTCREWEAFVNRGEMIAMSAEIMADEGESV